MSFKITGVGNALPEYILSNDKLSTMLDTSDEWISTRTGIRNRYILTSETITELAAIAANKALNHAGLKPEDLDLIICSTLGGEYLTPSLGCLLQKEIGAVCPALDINAACSGFIYALEMAAAFLDSGRMGKILVIAAERMSSYVDWKDRSSCVLFGDGAGCVILEKGENLLSIKLTAKGNDDFLVIGGSKGNSPFIKTEPKHEFLIMNGQEVFKFAVNSMCHDILDVLKEAGLTISDVKKFIPHQANQRIISLAKDKLKIPDDKIVSEIGKYGNTSSASIPIIISELVESGELVKDDIIVLSAFGGGFTTGACVIKI